MLGDDVVVLLEVVEVDELDRDVLAEGHRLLPGDPGGKLLVGLDQTVAADALDDRSQPVEYVVRTIGLGGDGWVQTDEGLVEVRLDECFLGLTGQMLVGKVVPAEAGDLVVVPSEARAAGVEADQTALVGCRGGAPKIGYRPKSLVST